MANNSLEENMARHDLAVSGARKICGCGNCFMPFDCGHTNKQKRLVPRIGKEPVCPLVKYNMTPDERALFERPAEDRIITRDEIWALCEECSHCEIVEKSGELVLTRKDFDTACVDCPVKDVEDGLDECEAEARMS